MKWVNPLPMGMRHGVRVYRPGVEVRRIADVICDLGWKGNGARVFRWRCGTVVVVRVGSTQDAALCAKFMAHHLGTYARHESTGCGPQRVHVIHDLNWAMHP